MATGDEASDEPTGDDLWRSEPLTAWERTGVWATGLALAASGAVSVFVSGNQAGSVALLVVGGAFLLRAGTGMPLLRLKGKDFEVIMARRARREIERAQAEEPKAAQKIVDAVTRVVPESTRDPVVSEASGRIYKSAIFQQLLGLRLSGELVLMDRSPVDVRTDFEIKTTTGCLIGVNLLYTHELTIHWRPLRNERLRIRETNAAGVLLITTAAVPSSANRTWNEFMRDAGKPIRIVQWRDERDNEALREAIDKIARRAIGTSNS